MMIARHSPSAHAAYHDLLRLPLDDRTADIRGTPTRVERKGRVYRHDSFRVSTDLRKTYIAEETPELLARIDRHPAPRALRHPQADRSRPR